MKRTVLKGMIKLLILAMCMMGLVTRQNLKAEENQSIELNTTEDVEDEYADSIEDPKEESQQAVEMDEEVIPKSEHSKELTTPERGIQEVDKENVIQSKLFDMEMKKPKITMSMSGGNMKYYGFPQILKIVIERNKFKTKKVAKGLVIKCNGVKEKVPLKWTTKGEKHIAKFNIVKDGKYEISFTYPRISGEKSNHISRKSFILDQVTPNIIITGISNIMNQNKIIPQIKITDKNLEPKNTTVSIVNVNTGQKEKLVTEYKKGQFIAVCHTLNRKKTSDNHYLIQIDAIDKAKNKNSIDKKFTINRNGSVFSLDKKTNSFKGKYFQRIDSDLILSENNITKLIQGGGNLLISRDGENINHVSYYCQRKKQNGWNQYQYILDKENFKKEGVYRIQIESEDLAKNYNNSLLKKSELAFVTDRTKPQVFFHNLEKNAIYNGSSHEVIMKVIDNMKVKIVKVFLNGKRVKVIKRKGDYCFNLEESNQRKSIKVSVEDYAGNKTTCIRKGILVTTNHGMQKNKNLFTMRIILLGMIAVGIVGFLTYHFISAKL